MKKMKKLSVLMVLSMAILLISCSDSDNQKISVRKINPSDSKDLLDLRQDVVSKASSSDANTLLNLCFTDFAFNQENRETVLLVYNTPDPGKIRSILLANSNFVKTCSYRGLDTAQIPSYISLNKEISRRN